MERPFSQACENNKAPILAVLKKHFSHMDYVLEVGSGTGQHAVYFAEQLPHLIWQPTDQQEYLQGIESWIAFSSAKNVWPPLLLNVNNPWPVSQVSSIFSANTLHIMSWDEVKLFFITIEEVLSNNGVMCLYGPFNRNGQYTSKSNAVFDQWLKKQNSSSAIRNFEAINQLAENAGLKLIDDCAMPANNSCLVFNKD